MAALLEEPNVFDADVTALENRLRTTAPGFGVPTVLYIDTVFSGSWAYTADFDEETTPSHMRTCLRKAIVAARGAGVSLENIKLRRA